MIASGKVTAKSSTYQRRLGAHHFAHLRAVAEGLPLTESALRYLGIDHGHQAVTAHRGLVERLRGLARRSGDKAWRLIGLTIRIQPGSTRPALEDFIAERDLDGWSEAEVLELYQQAWPEDQRASRRQRLRERQLQLLRQLESIAAERASPQDSIDAWFDPSSAERLMQARLHTLSDLAERIDATATWWRGIPAIGRTKASRISHYLDQLLPREARQEAYFSPPERENRSPRTPPEARLQTSEGAGLGSIEKSPQGLNRGLSGDLVDSDEFLRSASWRAGNDLVEQASLPAAVDMLASARGDAEVIQAWVAARAGSKATAISYQREALRFLLWLNRERDKGFRSAGFEDCLGYMSFLEHLPAEWISRRRSTVMGEGWAPFRGPLSHASRRQAVVVLGSFFAWLVDVGYLPLRNPWMLINRRTGDDAERDELDSRAFTPQAWQAITSHLSRQAPSPSRDRMVFLLAFVEATGLRAAELLSARLRAFRVHKGRLAMQVHGKGSRNRVIAVPGQAAAALDRYLTSRGLPGLADALGDLPVLASTKDPQSGIGYQALYGTLKRWLFEAIQASDLPQREREEALRASPHWLRHTFGTRALERKAPLEVVQRQLGHADPRTTMRYARAQLERLQSEMDQVFGAAEVGTEAGNSEPS